MYILDNKEKILEKVNKLTDIAKTNNNILSYDEIAEVFKEDELNADQMDKLYTLIESNGIDIVSSDREVEPGSEEDFENLNLAKLNDVDIALEDDYDDD